MNWGHGGSPRVLSVSHTRSLCMRQIHRHAEHEMHKAVCPDMLLYVQVIWPKLTTPEQSQALYKAMQNQQVYVNKKFQEGCAVLPLMEAQVLHAACDNPGTVVVPHLILPLLRERLEVLADAALKVSRLCMQCSLHAAHTSLHFVTLA